MQARDVMTANVVTVTESSTVREIVKALLRHRIGAVPVVDGAGHVVGIVSERDLLRSEGSERATQRLAELAQPRDKAHGRTASEVMTRSVVTVDEHAPLGRIAALLERRHIKRVPVLRDGKLVGIVSRANLLHGLADTIVEHHQPGAMQDRKLHDAVVEALLKERQLAGVLVNVTVSGGTARLWGEVDTAEQVAAAERVARSVPGIGSIENNIGVEPVGGVPL